MATEVKYVSKTQHYLKVKKPLLERQRRARMNKCLDTLKLLVAEFQGDDAILRMDKAEMLEATITFMRTQSAAAAARGPSHAATSAPQVAVDSFRNGYMNAVGEVSRVMACMPGMSVEVGKSVMTRLGCEFNRMLHQKSIGSTAHSTMVQEMQPVGIKSTAAPLSPASSGYHSDYSSSPANSPAPQTAAASGTVWRPW